MPYPSDAIRLNPAWTNDLLQRHWDDLARVAPDGAMPLLEARYSRKLRAREFGAGYYGVVLPTTKKGLVLKITSDPSEARFVEAALAMGPIAPGIVRYRAVYAVPRVRHRGRAVYVLWREEATAVGKTITPKTAPRAAAMFQAYMEYAYAVQQHLSRRPRARERVYALLAEMIDIARRDDIDAYRRLAKTPDGRAASCLLAAGITLMRMRSKQRIAATIGGSLLHYIEQGLLIEDTHRGNIGKVRRGGKLVAVLTDPGHVVPLRDALARVEPRSLRDAARSRRLAA
jgi:hypothetical protein